MYITLPYTANGYRQTTDKLMFKSVISTVRWIRKRHSEINWPLAWWYILSFSCYELLLLHFPFELMYARQMRVIMFWSQENKSKEWRNSVSTTKKYMQYIPCTHVLNTKKLRISLINKLSGLDTTSMSVMAIRVVEFSNGGYKIRKVFA